MTISVITYQTPSGDTIQVCEACEREIQEWKEPWPKNKKGEEYCSIYMGQHPGICDLCGKGEA